MAKRIISVIFSLIIVISFVGGPSVSAETVELSGFSWQTFGGEWTFDDTGFSLVGDGPSGWPKIITNTT